VTAFRGTPRDERALDRLERVRVDGPAADATDSAKKTVQAISTASDRKLSMVFMAALPYKPNYRIRINLLNVNYILVLIVQHGPIEFQ